MTLAKTPDPPYFAVVFTSQRTPVDDEGYAAMAQAMDDLARQQPGYLGIESARDALGFGITVSYWTSLDAIRAWRENVEHRAAQTLGRERWYRAYSLRVCEVRRAYGLER
jgi:heme-degrading monooxygenase HmoA